MNAFPPLLDRLQALATEHGRFDPDRRPEQLADLVAVADRARAVCRDVLAVAEN
ncbi:hypothetical protein GCM10023320_39400 [Pseudonocardia adelaidensis]|uniref:Uncharacterized protein n=1 Tax=Pseudonocardia adelaidensis TaxID=648754 RepID=A0ABP9NSF2_9PSEU